MGKDSNSFVHIDSLEELVDTISDLLGCPVTVEDVNFRLLAYSSHEKVTDAGRIATIINRQVPEIIINGLWRDGVIQQLKNSDNPIRVSPIDEAGFGSRIAIAVRNGNVLLGHIWVIGSGHADEEWQTQLLKEAAEAVGIKLLQHRSRRKNEHEGYHKFFQQILSGEINTQERIKERALQVKVSLPPEFSVIVFESPEEISESMYRQIAYLANTSKSVQVIMSSNEGQRLIFLVNPDARKGIPNKNCSSFISSAISQMTEKLGIAGLVGGCGCVYSNYRKIQTSYQEALTVIGIKRKLPEETKGIFHYPQLGFFRFIPAILEKNADEAYQNQALQKIGEYDQQGNSNLLKTLEIYLKYDNIKETASALHIHINTLNYRLKRIEEIGEIDLMDPMQKLILYFDLKTEKFLT